MSVPSLKWLYGLLPGDTRGGCKEGSVGISGLVSVPSASFFARILSNRFLFWSATRAFTSSEVWWSVSVSLLGEIELDEFNALCSPASPLPADSLLFAPQIPSNFFLVSRASAVSASEGSSPVSLPPDFLEPQRLSSRFLCGSACTVVVSCSKPCGSSSGVVGLLSLVSPGFLPEPQILSSLFRCVEPLRSMGIVELVFTGDGVDGTAGPAGLVGIPGVGAGPERPRGDGIGASPVTDGLCARLGMAGDGVRGKVGT